MVNVSLVVLNHMYGQPIFVSIGQSEEQFLDSAKDVLYEPEIARYVKHLYHEVQPAGCCFDTPGKPIMLWVKTLNRNPETWGTIGHEVFHATEAVMQRVDIRYSRSSCEAFAFMVGHITESIYKVLMDKSVM